MLGAVARLSASFDCSVLPEPPRLQMRTGSLWFEAPICVAELSAAASWWTSDCWPSACTLNPLQPHLGDCCVCVAVCVGTARFDASAVEEASFSCVRAPSLPELPIRTGSAELPNEPPQPHSERPGSWSADDAANAPCQIDDFCPSACTPLPACVWLPDWVVGASFDADAVDSASFDCDTVP